jgi:acetyl-CoA C-acetyltransferase
MAGLEKEIVILSAARTPFGKFCGAIGLLDQDEHPRPDTTREALAGLKPVFRRDGIVTAGNASGISDGAAAVVLSTSAEARRREIQPLARIVSWCIAGCEPAIMGIGPVPAIKMALERAGLALSKIDLVEVNEASPTSTLPWKKSSALIGKR